MSSATQGPEPAGARDERRPIVLESGPGPEVLLDGVRTIYLGGTNYFGMSTDPRVGAALAGAVRRWGLSPGGGRTTSGTAAPHLEVEACMAALLGVGSVAVSASGYQADAVLLQTFRASYGVALVDERAHSSVREAVATSGLPSVEFRHRDPDHVRDLARAERDAGRRGIICTDGVFPVDGILAPLEEYTEIGAELGLGLLVDDAHGIGVLGEGGRGTPEHLGIPHAGLLYAGSFSKAFGAFGGFAAGPSEMERGREGSPSYVGATPIPAAVAVAVCVAVGIVCGDRDLRRRLVESARRMKAGLRALGLEFPETPMPVARFVVGDARRGRALHGELRRRGVLIPFNAYPGGPEGGYFRLVVTAAHTPEQIDRTLGILRDIL